MTSLDDLQLKLINLRQIDFVGRWLTARHKLLKDFSLNKSDFADDITLH